jgi:dTMP kinase
VGRIVVFEGLDGSGKSTQYKLLTGVLELSGIDFRALKFPQYDEESSALVRMYLNGEFGTDPASVNPYAASTFYAVDRYASYVKKWRDYYESGGLIITDRYTTANAIHQGSKLTTNSEKSDFFDWLYDLEFNKLGLPEPDLVFYFDIPVELSIANLRHREKETGTKADIHEADMNHLINSVNTANIAAIAYRGKRVICTEKNQYRSMQSIHSDVVAEFKNVIGGI